MKDSCLNCSYCKKEKDAEGKIVYYCADRDCTVDPYDPECSYDEDEDEEYN